MRSVALYFSFIVKHYAVYKWQILFLGVIGFLSSVAGGLGIGAIVPLLSVLTGKDEMPEDVITSFIVSILRLLPFSLNIFTILSLIVSLFLLRSATLFSFGLLRARILYRYKVSSLNDLFEKVLYVRWQFFLKQKMGYMQNIFLRDVEKSADLLEAISYLPYALVNVCVLLTFAFLISPNITFFTLAGGIVIFSVFKPLLRKLQEINSILVLQNKVVTQFLAEHLLGMKNLKISASLEEAAVRARKTFETWRWIEFRSSLINFINKNFFEPASVVFIALAIALFHGGPVFSFASFAATMLLLQRIYVYMQHVQIVLNNIVDSYPYAVQAASFKETLLREQDVSPGSRSFDLTNSIEFKEVWFEYEEGRPVLQGVSFSIRQGETVGLVGSSGSGKTSVADLMMRLFEPNRGQIFLDGHPASNFDLYEWRKEFGYMSQDFFLLNDTIGENIKFYQDGIGSREIGDAAQASNIYGFVDGLPKKFDTVVGDRGVMLSAGQRQRIVLARVLARRPKVLILDEATSALDNESEMLVQSALRGLKGKITVFIIAHRLTTLLDVDKILVLDQGKIIEEGSPKELLDDNGSYFSRLYTSTSKRGGLPPR